MKDIDFDELDKAVNSLMATTTQPTSDDASAQPSMTPNPAPDAAIAPVRSVQAATVPAAAEDASAKITVRSNAVAPAVKRSGRFMDMVSTPAVDAKSRSLAPSVSSREGLSITPRAEASATQQPVVAEVPPADTVPAEATFDTMPDPIDIATPTPSESAEPVVEPTEEPETPSFGLAESPFLSDAKVEKRPLNAGTPELSIDDAFTTPTQSPPIDLSELALDESTQNDKDEPSAVPVAPELSSDLIAIESSEKIEATPEADATETTGQVDTPSAPLGASSIAQQYQSKASSGDQSHAAIYDTSQYPEPVSHPAKGKSGWLWVLWVALLLGIGAGGAVLLYNLGIIP